MLGGIAESSARVVTLIAGPPALLSLRLTYASTADFLARFPTEALQIAALRNLWTARLSLVMRAPCTALDPVIS